MTDLVVTDVTEVVPIEVFLDGTSVTEQELEASCQKILTNLEDTGEEEEISNAVKNLVGIEAFAGKAKMKLIFGWSQWRKTKYPEENFVDWYVSKFGAEKLTVQKNLMVGELLMSEAVPEEVKTLPGKSLVHVARAVNGGYEIDDETWDELESAGNEGEVRDIIRKVKNKPQRKGSMNIYLEPDGSLTVWKDDQKANVGWLNLLDSESNPLVKSAISRIVDHSDIRRK